MTLNARAWFTPAGLAVAGAVALGIVAAVYVARKGGIRQAAAGLVGGAAGAANEAAAGVVGEVGSWVGLPRPEETISDVDRARELIGQFGYFEASKRADAATFARAVWEGPLYYSNEGRGR